jgi:hypothetical protein
MGGWRPVSRPCDAAPNGDDRSSTSSQAKLRLRDWSEARATPSWAGRCGSVAHKPRASAVRRRRTSRSSGCRSSSRRSGWSSRRGPIPVEWPFETRVTLPCWTGFGADFIRASAGGWRCRLSSLPWRGHSTHEPGTRASMARVHGARRCGDPCRRSPGRPTPGVAQGTGWCMPRRVAAGGDASPTASSSAPLARACERSFPWERGRHWPHSGLVEPHARTPWSSFRAPSPANRFRPGAYGSA